jgi:hypothetical protein
MAKLILRCSCLILPGIVAAAAVAVAQSVSDTTPKITSVSKITTAEHQTITITGSGFGTHAAYTGDSDYISFYDKKKKWEAGYEPDNDTVTLIVNSWTNTKITLGGFAGAWGTHDYTLAVGNKEEIRLWNAQGAGGPFGLTCDDGCVKKTVTIVAATTSTEIRSSPNPSVYGEPVTFTAVVTSGDGAQRCWEAERCAAAWPASRPPRWILEPTRSRRYTPVTPILPALAVTKSRLA